MSVRSRVDSSRFFSDSGSMDGSTTYIGIPRRPSNPGSEKTAASYWSANCRKKDQAAGRADEQSKWQRQTHRPSGPSSGSRSEEHTSELQSLRHLVCRLLLEKKKAVVRET